jgi:hypothetical protein
MGIALESFLSLKCQALHAAAHFAVAGGDCRLADVPILAASIDIATMLLQLTS